MGSNPYQAWMFAFQALISQQLKAVCYCDDQSDLQKIITISNHTPVWTRYSSNINLASGADCSAVKVVGRHNIVQPLFSAILICKIAEQHTYNTEYYIVNVTP